MYYKGFGTSQGKAEARRWFIRAAKQGNGDAQHALAVLGVKSEMVTKFEYLELVPSLLLGLWILLHFLSRGRKHLDFHDAALLLLGFVCVAMSCMSLYVIIQGGMFSCPYPLAFRVVRRSLIGLAILIFVTVILPAKKEPGALPTAS